MRVVFCIVIAWWIAGSVLAQGLQPVDGPRRWSLAPDVGVMVFYGDIPARLGTNVGLFGGYHLAPKWQVQAGARWSDVSSRANERYRRRFQNDMIIYQARVLYGLGQALLTDRFAPRLQPYVLLGMGGIYNNVTGVAVVDTPEDAQNYKGSQFSFNSGFGLQYYLNSRFDLRVELEHQFATSDWIDGNNYQGGANKANDQLTFLHVGLAIKLGKRSSPALGWNHLDPETKQGITRLLTEAPKVRAQAVSPGEIKFVTTGQTVLTERPVASSPVAARAPVASPTPVASSQLPVTPAETSQATENADAMLAVRPWTPAWHVIGGSSPELASARVVSRRYLEQGLTPTIEYVDIRHPLPLRIYRVSLAEFASREAAFDYLKELRGRLNANLYLLPPQ